MNLNRVTVAGNLTRDPEIRFGQSGMAICKVGLAVSHRVKKGDNWEEVATFIDITIFGKRAEAFEKHHGKGDGAFFEGRLEFDTWEDKSTGAKRSKLYVIANEWQFVGGGKQERQEQGGESRSSSRSYDKFDSGPVESDSTPF